MPGEVGEHYMMEESFERFHGSMQRYGISIDYLVSMVCEGVTREISGKGSWC